MAKIETDSLGEEQLRKLGEEVSEEEKPEKERRREYKDLGLEFGEKKEQVACHALALALAMEDEACREEEMPA